MEYLIELIIKKYISIEQLISWLNYTTEISELKEFNNSREEFIPYFLYYIKGEADGLLHASSRTALTPIKSTSELRTAKGFSLSKLSQKFTPIKKESSSKAKTLNFSEGSNIIANDSCCNTSLPELEKALESPECVNTVSLQFKTPKKQYNLSDSFISDKFTTGSPTLISYNTSTPKTNSNRYEYRKSSIDNANYGKSFSSCVARKAGRKNVLADYIDSNLFSNSLRSNENQSVKENSNSSSELGQISDLNIDDKELFPVVGSVTKKRINVKKKRINPTRLAGSGDSNESYDRANNAFFQEPRKQIKQNVFIEATEDSSNSLDYERKLLREKKDKLKREVINSSKSFDEDMHYKSIKLNSNQRDESNSLKLLDSSNKCLLNSSNESPTLSKVTCQSELSILAQVYSCLILLNLIPNIMVELHFLVQLLTCEEKSIYKNKKEGYLNSVHNCVFFSIKALSSLLDCLRLLDRSFLKALSENKRIHIFNQHFIKKLSCLIEQIPLSKNSVQTRPKSPILSVSFQTETDNKQNFPSTIAFQIFRKQRDLFYEVLRSWEDNHLTAGWSFAQVLGSKVKYILNLQSSPVNLSHLARLFLSQLLTMCKGDDNVNLIADVEDAIFLSELKKHQPNKYKKLQERLIMPAKCGGPVPVPSFPGSQEFFKNFIASAHDYSFNVHLKNVITSKIADIHDFCIKQTDIEDRENSENFRDDIIFNIQTLRLLGKFLGLVEFLPYQTKEPFPDNVMSNQIALRNKTKTSLPLFAYLRRGLVSGCLVLVVPWIIEVLSMVDPVALHTQDYLTIVFELLLIYKMICSFRLKNEKISLCMKCKNSPKLRRMSSRNSLVLKLLIGWFLNLPNVPDGLFYTNEEDADINNEEYSLLREIAMANYSQTCLDCLYKIMNFSDSFENYKFSSSKKVMNVTTPLKKLNYTNVEVTGNEISPMTTPSKYLECSMIDTPDVTPNKIHTDEDEDLLSKFILDNFELVNSENLVVFCPFISELKGILNEFSLGNTQTMNGGNVRKITPLSAEDRVIDVTGNKLQSLLEENFFHNQPSSSKKSVDFIIERLFSKISRNFQSHIVPKLKENGFLELRDFVLSSLVSGSSEYVNEDIDKYIKQLSMDISVKSRQEVLGQMNDLLKEKTLKSSLAFLLPSSTTPNSLDICYKVVKRTLNEKISTWMNSHIAKTFCLKELTSESQKIFKRFQKNNMSNSAGTIDSSLGCSISGFSAVLEDSTSDFPADNSVADITNTESGNQLISTRNQYHNKDLMPPSALLLRIKSDVKQMILPSRDSLSNEEIDIHERILTIKRVMNERQDVTLPMAKALENLSGDWMAALCVKFPHLITEELMKEFVALWSPQKEGGIFQKPSTLSVFLSPRNIMILGQRKQDECAPSWQKLQDFLFQIVKLKLISLSQIQEWCVVLMRNSWPQDILCGVSSVIRGFIEKLMMDKDFAGDEEIIQLIDWVSWVTSDMENLTIN